MRSSRCAGNVSVNDMPLSATAPAAVFGIVIVSVDVAPEAIDVGENALAMATGAVAVSVAVAGVSLVTPCVSVSAPAGITLLNVLAEDAVTVTPIVHVAFAATLPFSAKRPMHPRPRRPLRRRRWSLHSAWWR